MKTNTTILQVVLLAITLYACSSEDKTAIKTNIISPQELIGKEQILNASSYIQSIEYIPLETTTTNLIGEIKQIIIENGTIFITNQSSSPVLRFSEQGNFLNSIGSIGEGPEDLLDLRYMDYIPKEDKLIIQSYGKYTLYKPSGKVKKIYKSIEYPDASESRNILHIDSNKYLHDVVSYLNRNYLALVTEFTEDSMQLVKSIPNYFFRDRGDWINSFSMEFDVAKVYKYKDQVRYHKIWNDTIFTISNDLSWKEAYIFDYGEHRINENCFMDRDGLYIRDIIYAKNIFESDPHLFIEFFFGKHSNEIFTYTKITPSGKKVTLTNQNVYAIFDKQRDELKLMKQPIKQFFGFKNDIDNGPVIWPRYITSDNRLVSWMDAFDFLDLYEQMENPDTNIRKVAEQLKVADNPVLIIATLK